MTMRPDVENPTKLFDLAERSTVALLVVGDPMHATTPLICCWGKGQWYPHTRHTRHFRNKFGRDSQRIAIVSLR